MIIVLTKARVRKIKALNFYSSLLSNSNEFENCRTYCLVSKFKKSVGISLKLEEE